MLKFRSILLLTVVSMALAACMPKAPDVTADEAVLRGELSAWMDAYNAGDAEGVTRLYAEGAHLMAPGAAVAIGRPGIFALIGSDIQKTRAAGLALNADEITGVGVDGDTGWLSGEWLMIRDTWNSDGPGAAQAAEEPVEEILAD